MLRKSFINKNIYSELAKELILLAEMDGGQSTCLDLIKNLPVEVQIKIVQYLALENNPKLINLFQLLARETQTEVQKVACRILRKFQYSGHKIEPLMPKEIKPQNVQAFVSLTRLTGVCILVFIMGLGNSEYQAHYFSLYFNHLGIKEYFQYCSTNRKELFSVIDRQDLVEIDFFTAQRLLLDAYQQNLRYGTKPASGLSQYNSFLINQQVSVENTKLNPIILDKKEMNPERIVNAYFFALKNMDAPLVYDLAAPSLQEKFGDRDDFIANWLHPLEKYVFIKSVSLGWENSDQQARGKYQLIAGNENDELQKIDFDFDLKKVGNKWYIKKVIIECLRPVGNDDPLNPLNYQVYVAVYKINDYLQVKNIFDNWEKVHLTGEFKEGFCYKWFKAVDILDTGIDVSRDVYGEFILTKKELIIFSSHLKNTTEIGYYFQEYVRDQGGLDLHILIKGSSQIKEVYRVITDTNFSLSRSLLSKNRLYYFNLAESPNWYNLLKNKATDRFILGSKTQVFHLKEERLILEVLIFRNHAFVFLYNGSPTILTNYFPDFQDNAWELTCESGYYDEKEKWRYYKLISSLRKDSFTRVFVPNAVEWEITKKKMRIVN